MTGRKVNENIHSESRRVAEQRLKDREGRVARGETITPRVDRVRWEEAAADLREFYAVNETRDLTEYDRRVQHFNRFFAGRRIVTIGGAGATAYAAARTAQGIKGATIRRELGTLSKALRVAYENGKLQRLPIIRKPKEAEPRSGFVERDVFETIVKRMPEPHALGLRIAYAVAWRRRDVFDLE